MRSDWFVIEPHQAQSIGHAPGVQKDEKRDLWICHRSHLPLLGLKVPKNGISAQVDQICFGDGETELRWYQRIGVEFVLGRRGTLLADAMRVGKTGTIVAAHDPGSGPLVVVGPLATRSVWMSWFARRWPEEQPVVVVGKHYDRALIDDAKLIFLHWDVLIDWQSIGLGRRIGTLAFDEAHKLSNRKSRRTQAARIMAPQAHRVIAATGTPLWNKPDGLYSLLDVCGPAGWGPFGEFSARYCGGHPGSRGWVTGEATWVEEFRARLSEIMIRRVWAELTDDLPPTRRHVERQEISAQERHDLDLLAAAMASATDRRTVIGEQARYRRLVGRLKAPLAARLARTAANKGPVVVWVWHKRVADGIAGALEGWIPYWIVNGDTAEHCRDGILDAWRACPDGVMIMSLGVGQAGIDLSHTAQCIFAELDWTPAVIGQAEMRTFSPVRSDDVTYVVADHDIDYALACVLAAKCQQAMLLGTPAADTAIDVISQIFSGDVPNEADLDGLAARLVAKVQEKGTTFV
jgi:hypothetical protein